MKSEFWQTSRLKHNLHTATFFPSFSTKRMIDCKRIIYWTAVKFHGMFPIGYHFR